MEQLIERCCGLDVHKKTVTACMRIPGSDGGAREVVRTFGTTTHELLVVHDWLRANGVTHVAMESTGVYWKPVYYVLEDSFTVLLVNAAHLKRVPGRKTDVSDCVWIAQLLAHGLLRGSFVPPRAIRELRDLTRYRKRLIQERAREANRVHKVLEDANIKLASVATDILGVSGRAMLEALLHGTSDPAVLADLAKGRLRQKLPALRQALTGRFRDHHGFLVGQLLAHLDYLDEAVEQLSARIAEVIRPFEPELQRLMTIPTVKRRTAEVILAEVGPDMHRFPSAAHLTSWAGMCPGNNESAGKHRSGKTRKGSKWLRSALIEVGQVAGRIPDTALGARYRRLARRRGKKKAVVAIGRHILEVSFHILSTGSTYCDLGPDYFVRARAEHVQRRCIRMLERLGHQVTLTPLPTAA
jgi:transposase